MFQVRAWACNARIQSYSIYSQPSVVRWAGGVGGWGGQPPQEIYAGLYVSAWKGPNVRERRDTGITKGSTALRDDTEKAWISRRRAAVELAVQTSGGGSNNGSFWSLDDQAASLETEHWTERHEKLCDAQESKWRSRKALAMLDGSLVDAEVTAEVTADAEKEKQARQKRARDMSNAKRRMAKIHGKKGATIQDMLGGQRTHVDVTLRDQAALTTKLQDLACVIVEDPLEASAFVVADASKPGCRVSWMSVLTGAILFPAKAVTEGSGGIIKYKAAVSNERFVWLTPDFKARHPAVTLAIEKAAVARGSRWKCLASLADFTREYQRAKRQRRPARVVLVKRKDEVLPAEVAADARVFDVISFLESLRALDLDVTRSGMCGR